MQRFTYHRQGAALRTQVWMYCAMLMGDVVTVAVLMLWLRRPWNWAGGAMGLLLLCFAVWTLTRPLRTCHSVDEAALHLRFGRFGLVVPREAIIGVGRPDRGLPRGLSIPTLPPVYRPDTDCLYLLAEKKGLVEVRLNRPLEAVTGKQGTFQFTSLLLSLDDPAAFVAGLAGESVERRVEARIGPTAVGHVTGGGAIALTGLTKRFGDFTAVRSVSLGVEPGEVLAFLGSNGAGKTTTIKMMTGLLRPTAGTVTIAGHDVWADGPAARRLVGYVPDVPLLYEGLTAREFLWLMAGLYELPRAEGRRRADELLALLKMERWSDHLIRTFSLGMKRKMAIAAALVHRPQVLLLDEVTNGLDPRATREVKDFICSAAQSGTAVFLTTHLLDVAGELADRVAVIHRGELRAVGTLAELQAQAGLPGAGLEELFLALTGDVAGEVSA